MLLRPILTRILKHQRVANLCIHKNVGPALASPENSSSPSCLNEKSLGRKYVISYLVNSCGLSTENAVSASKKVHFDGPDKPNAVLSFLEKQGFSKTQTAELVRRHPRVLVSNPEKFLLPKIEFFSQVAGISEKDVIAAVSRRPDLFTRSLKNSLAPIYNYLEDNIGAVKARTLLKRGSWIFTFNCDPGKTLTLIPNVGFLRKLGVPQRNIELALFNYPNIFWPKHAEFREIVEEVKQMDFDPLKSTFVLAINARLKGHLTSWDQCYEVYSKWGWSKDDIHMAFRKHPGCMLLSEKKISMAMDFLVNKVGRDPRSVALLPYVLFYSMEKRIVPRCSIVHLLSLKGLLKKDWSLGSVLCPTEKVFLERYVTKYAEELPQIYDIYQGKLVSSKLKSVGEDKLLFGKQKILLPPILPRMREHQRVAHVGPSLPSPENSTSPSSLDEKSLEKEYVISYLVNSCGLSTENAKSASKGVHFHCSDKPNAVLNFLKKQGFSKTQTSELVRRQPRVLVSDPEKSLLPKIEFLSQVARISEKDVLKSVSKCPGLLRISLKHRLAPVYDYLKATIGDFKAHSLLRRGFWNFNVDLKNRLIPNVDYLRKLGVPQHSIELALYHFPNICCPEHVKFKQIVEEVKQMDFDPSKSVFILAICARRRRNLTSWDKCFKVYSKWGWSKDDIHMAFRKHPNCMVLSEKKISTALDFLVNEVGRDPRSLAYCPHVLLYSMEKRIIPRCSIVHLLSLKGFVKKDWSLNSVLCPVEKAFLERYVTKYAEKLPQIYDMYQEKLGLSSKVKSVEQG